MGEQLDLHGASCACIPDLQAKPWLAPVRGAGRGEWKRDSAQTDFVLGCDWDRAYLYTLYRYDLSLHSYLLIMLFPKWHFQDLAFCLISVTILGLKNALLCALGKYCLFRQSFKRLEELQRLGEHGNKEAGLCPLEVCTTPVFCDIESHRKVLEINVVPTATRIHFSLSYMRMGSCHTVV